MLRFDKSNIKELQEFLRNSYAHDAKLNSIEYDYGRDRLKAEIFNPIFNVNADIVFCNIAMVYAIKKNEFGCRETIISLTAEDDFSYLRNYIQIDGENEKDSLYLLFQMFSGDELHIISREVIINSAQDGVAWWR